MWKIFSFTISYCRERAHKLFSLMELELSQVEFLCPEVQNKYTKNYLIESLKICIFLLTLTIFKMRKVIIFDYFLTQFFIINVHFLNYSYYIFFLQKLLMTLSPFFYIYLMPTVYYTKQSITLWFHNIIIWILKYVMIFSVSF